MPLVPSPCSGQSGPAPCSGQSGPASPHRAVVSKAPHPRTLQWSVRLRVPAPCAAAAGARRGGRRDAAAGARRDGAAERTALRGDLHSARRAVWGAASTTQVSRILAVFTMGDARFGFLTSTSKFNIEPNGGILTSAQKSTARHPM